MLTLLVVSVEVHFQLTTHMDSFFLWFLRQINATTTIAKAIPTTVAAITGIAIVTDCVADCSDWPEKRMTIKVVKYLSALYYHQSYFYQLFLQQKELCSMLWNSFHTLPMFWHGPV